MVVAMAVVMLFSGWTFNVLPWWLAVICRSFGLAIAFLIRFISASARFASK
jgi:hypothetical protein